MCWSFKLYRFYSMEQEEINILSSTTGNKKVNIQPVLNAGEIQQLQSLVRDVSINDDSYCK